VIRVTVLQKGNVDKYVWGASKDEKYVDWPKFARAKADANLPSFLAAYDTETGEAAVIGFKTRRTSHSTDIEWWSGDRVDLIAEALKAVVWSAILEGRKRVESFHIIEDGRPVVDEAFLAAGFKYEGYHKDFTDKLQNVNVYGHVWLQDGVPVPGENVEQVELVVNERVQFYYNKNMELYAKDIDLHREDKQGITFATHIKKAVETVYTIDRVKVRNIKGWHGNDKKSSYLFGSDQELTEDLILERQ
jgi:hypothetical protein